VSNDGASKVDIKATDDKRNLIAFPSSGGFLRYVREEGLILVWW